MRTVYTGRVVASAVLSGRRAVHGSPRPVQGLELDVVLPKQGLIVPKALQQFSLGKSAPPLALRGDDALRGGLDAVGAGEFAIAFDFPLLTQHAS
jgi:hypothetical protein